MPKQEDGIYIAQSKRCNLYDRTFYIRRDGEKKELDMIRKSSRCSFCSHSPHNFVIVFALYLNDVMWSFIIRGSVMMMSTLTKKTEQRSANWTKILSLLLCVYVKVCVRSKHLYAYYLTWLFRTFDCVFCCCCCCRCLLICSLCDCICLAGAFWHFDCARSKLHFEHILRTFMMHVNTCYDLST